MSVISSPLHRQQGYTLIELAVVVAIVAVLIAGGLSSYQRFNHAQRIKVTNDHLDIIEKALVDYFNANRFLPCPALNTANYLTGSFNASVYTSPNCATPRGALPVNTLGLDRKYLLDGWGNYFTYALSPGYGNANDFYSPATSGTEIEVRETSGTGRLTDLRSAALRITGGTALQFGALYVVISHGNNGLGAFNRTGAQIPTTGINANENENVNANMIFVSRPLASATSAIPFDDIVRFGNKAMFGEGAMYKTPYMKIRYAERSFRRATNFLAANTPAGSANIAGYNDAPTAPGTAVENGAQAAARILVNLWNDTNAASIDETWRCVDNLLYLSTTTPPTGITASATQAPSSYGQSTGANYRYTRPNASYTNQIGCACLNNQTQHFNIANTTIPLGACR